MSLFAILKPPLMAAREPRLAIITGAASGLGRAFCRQLIAASADWHIVGVDVDEAGVRQTLAELRLQGGPPGECVRMDVTDGAAWLELRERLQREWPRLELLINNAGICMSAEMGDGSLDAWRRVIEVNLLGVLNGCHAMAPWLKQSATPACSPAVINIASIMGLLPAPALGAYCASKAGVLALSEAMYAELRPHGVRVTVAAPGFFRTALLERGAFAASRHRDQAEQLVATAKIDADAVARETLRASSRGRLYSVVGRRSRWFWRWKRAAPVSLLNALSRRYERMMARVEKNVDGAGD